MNSNSSALIDLSGNNTMLLLVFIVFAIAFIIRFFIIKPSSRLGKQLRAQDKWFIGVQCLVRSIVSCVGFIFITCFIFYGYTSAMLDSFMFIGFAILAIVFLIASIINWIEYMLWKRS